jgi:protein-S-isoprenylcysteine O-methyltransferase Ste14
MDNENLFRIAFWVLMAGILIMRVFFTVKVRRSGERVLPDHAAIQREGWGAFLFRFVAFFLLIGWLVAYTVDPAWVKALSIPIPTVVRVAGFLISLISLGFWFWVQLALSEEWSPQLQLREDHRLVTTGPFARIRHPMYSAMVFWGIGLALLTANWVFIIMAGLVSTVFILRVPKEEQMMIEKFGEEYRAYMRKTGRFLPKI